MSKNKKTHDANKGSHSNKGHAKDPNHGNGSTKEKSSRQMDPGSELSAGGKSKGSEWMNEGGRSKEKGWVNEGGQAAQEGWLKEGGKAKQEPWLPEISTSPTSLFSKLKNACLPKALMLTLPFIALGAYLIIVS